MIAGITKRWSGLAIRSSGIVNRLAASRSTPAFGGGRDMAKKLDLKEAPEDVWPICPRCKKELQFIWVKSKGLGFVERKQFLLCPHCRCFLGFGNINFM